MATARKRRGRPTTPARVGERSTLSIRANALLKSRLLAAAESNSRSLSQEAELRLEQSFRDQLLLHEILELAFGKPLAGILLTIGGSMNETGRIAALAETRTLEGSAAWLDNPYGYDQAVQAALQIFEGLRPEGDPAATRGKLKVATENLGALIANGRLHALQGEGITVSLQEWAAPVRALLGPLVDRIEPEISDVATRLHFEKKRTEDEG